MLKQYTECHLSVALMNKKYVIRSLGSHQLINNLKKLVLLFFDFKIGELFRGRPVSIAL